jgi:FMN reductase
LIVEHQLRPLFGFFEAFALPTAVYAVDRDFTDGVLVADHIKQRVAQAIAEAGRALAGDRQTRLAAE